MSLLALVDAIHAGRAQAYGEPASGKERPEPSEVVMRTRSGSAAVRVLPAISASRHASASQEARRAARCACPGPPPRLFRLPGGSPRAR